jgi:hypothetical protein
MFNVAKSRVANPTAEDNGIEGDAAFPFGAEAGSPPTPEDTTPTQEQAEPQTAPLDEFDPAALRLTQEFVATAGVKKALLSVPARKPDKSWFVRVHPDPNYRLPTAVIELKEDREIYLIAPALRAELATEATFKVKMLAAAINRQGVVFLWECSMPRPDGRADEWSRTALEAVEMATKGWVRITANMSLGAYDVYQANAQLSDPDWPTATMAELLRISFKDRYINTLDHPVLRKLRGEV